MLNDIKDELTKRIPSTEEDIQTGSADVLQIFEITQRKKKVSVAGCRVTDGSLEKKHLFKLIRNGEVVHRGESIYFSLLLNISLLLVFFFFIFRFKILYPL